MLKLIMDSLEGLPEALASVYKKDDTTGKYTLQVEGGAVPLAQVKEFRDNNINLARQKDDLTAQLEAWRILGESVEDVKSELEAAAKIKRQVENKQLVDAQGLDQTLEQRTKEMRETLESEANRWRSSYEKERGLHERTKGDFDRWRVERMVMDAAASAGVVGSALPDVTNRAHLAGWRINEQGDVVRTVNGNNGPEIKIGSDGVKPQQLREWLLREVKDQAPHLWAQNVGGGAGGGGTNGSGDNTNPFAEKTRNLTKMGQMLQSPDPAVRARARQLAKDAGIVLDE
jgi:hypothetical protein